MAGLFQSFRSSSMPKRLLRYALSRLDLLDSDALDLENLDLALGRNTVFEFRDVGIRLKKLEELLKLPETFSLQKAKVLLLRVTIPMDFYTSPITIEVDGVDVKLKVLGIEKLKTNHASASKAPEDTLIVPNTVDLAQSFLETQPSSERKKLEKALAADTQDLVASVAMSDDGSSEEEPTFGTGQPLSLPTFLANFLQGIVDRMQIKIKGVTFQLDMEVPVDLSSPNTEPVSFQIALQDIDIEGVTMHTTDTEASSIIAPKEGKRQISLANVRAYLISEANVFPTLTRSPSLASPSVASSPLMTRNPPSRETTSLSQGSIYEQILEASQEGFQDQHIQASQASLRGNPMAFSQASLHEQLMEASQTSLRNQSVASSHASLRDPPMASSRQSFREHVMEQEDPQESHYPLEDSEEALGIPYDMSEHDEEQEDESPATPRASVYQEFNNSPENQQFHSPQSPGPMSPPVEALETELPRSATLEPHSASASVHTITSPRPGLTESSHHTLLDSTTFPPQAHGFRGNLVDDLAQSQLYTHDEAESMYMSAFSRSGISPLADSPEIQSSRYEQQRAIDEAIEAQQVHQSLQPTYRHSPQQSPRSSPPQSPQQSSDGTPMQSPRISPPKSPQEVVEEMLQESPRQSPRQSPPQSPQEASPQSPPKSPQQPFQEPAAQSPQGLHLGP
ncbi:Autophagy-related protein 2 [Cladobotryum mycophilum]|uniref:Autophagy-related protein 2 n=1 Tax=Cladobotryum mycophilum TaxID=491253 RepID=A0ABR0SKK3_9HYPO